ncbi:MAG: hypothetical protein H7222_05260 [Methylotenera sp.]|nr:hypothetical protein [Oligoflexia bacterium]
MSPLLEPTTLGDLKLKNRVILAPLTRSRATGADGRTPNELMLEVTDAVVSVWGASRVGMHLAPRGDAHSVGDTDPAATFGHVARELGRRKIAFICARESLGQNRIGPQLKKEFGGAYIANEGFTRETAEEVLIKGEADAVGFGVSFLSNPDLPERFRNKQPLNAPNFETFYAEGAVGYTDYPVYHETVTV